MNKVESGSDQGNPRASVVHNLQVAVASYAESCPETLCSRNALQQQLAFMHNSGAGDSCQAAIGPSPQKKKNSGERPKKKTKQTSGEATWQSVHSRVLVSWSQVVRP